MLIRFSMVDEKYKEIAKTLSKKDKKQYKKAVVKLYKNTIKIMKYEKKFFEYNQKGKKLYQLIKEIEG